LHEVQKKSAKKVQNKNLRDGIYYYVQRHKEDKTFSLQ